MPEAAADDLIFDESAFADNDKQLLTLAPNVAFHIKNYIRWDDIFSRKYPVNHDGRGCQIPNLGIHASGDVALCCIDYNATTKLGNIFEKSLPEILNDPLNIKIIQDLRKGIYHFEGCQSCKGYTTLVGKHAYLTVKRPTVRKPLSAVKRTVKRALGK